VNILQITVADPDAALVTYGAGALLRIQSSATEAGAYANLTGAGATPTVAIVTGQTIYVVTDPGGDWSTWYKYRLEAADGDPAGSYSDAFLAPNGTGLLCDLEDVKLRLGQSSTDDTDDELLVTMCQEISSWITNHIHRRLYELDYTSVVLDGDGGRVLRVPMGLLTVTNVEVAPATGESYAAVAGSYFLRPKEYDRPAGWPATELHLSDLSGDYFPSGYDTVRLTGTFGWASVPAEVREIAASTVVRAWHAKQAGQTDIIGNDDTGRPQVSRYVSKRDRDTLARYDPYVLVPG
jgi:hypothetical protein